MKSTSSSGSEGSASAASSSVEDLYPSGFPDGFDPRAPVPTGWAVEESGGAAAANLQAVQSARLAGVDAAQVLRDAAATLEARGQRYDTNGTLFKERSMPDIVARFEAATGIKMTTAQGYQFMVCLKEERIARDPNGYDNYVDLIAYLALQLEAGQSPTA